MVFSCVDRSLVKALGVFFVNHGLGADMVKEFNRCFFLEFDELPQGTIGMLSIANDSVQKWSGNSTGVCLWSLMSAKH